MRRTRHVVLPVKSWQYTGFMVVSLACLTLGLVSRDRGGRSGSLAGPELKHTAPHEVDACPNVHPFTRLPPYDESALQKVISDEPAADVRNSVRSQISRDSRSVNIESRISRVRSLDRYAERSSMSRDRIMDSVDRRSANTDRRIRSVGMTRFGDDRSKRQALIRSRSIELRENRGSVVRERRNDAQNRLSNNADRRTRVIGTSSARDDDGEKQRLITRSQARRSTDDVTRSRSSERRSVGERSNDAHRREKRNDGLLRRTVRSTNGRETRENRFVRMSRTDDRMDSRDRRSANRLEVNALERQRRHTDVSSRSRSVDESRRDVRRTDVHSDERRSTEQRDIDLMRRQSRRGAQLVRSQSVDVIREDVRSRHVRSLERRSTEKRSHSPVERQERRTSALAGSRDVRLSRSRDVSRADVRRESERSDKRGSSILREVNRVERQERRTRSLEGSRNVRLSRSRDVGRADVRREAERSDARRSSKLREVSRVERQERRTKSLEGSPDVRLSRSGDVSRVDVRRESERSNERRSSKLRDVSRIERQEKRTNLPEKTRDVRQTRSHDIRRTDSRRENVEANERRSLDRREMSPVNRREKRTDMLARSRDVSLSRSDTRRVAERRETNPVERQERRMNILSRSRDVQRLQFRDATRADVRENRERSEERGRRMNTLGRSRDVERRQSRLSTRADVRTIEERSEERRSSEMRRQMNSSERLESRTNILARSRDVRLSRSRDVNRADSNRLEKRSAERRSSERRDINSVERQERRMNTLTISRDVRMSQSRDIRDVTARREDVRSIERKFSDERRVINPVERQQRRVANLAISRDVRQLQSHDVNRADIRKVGVRSEQRSLDRIERLERRAKPSERSVSRDVNRLDVRGVEARHQERRSVEQRDRHTTIELQERRTIHSAISRNVPQSRSRDVARLDVSRLGEKRSQGHRAVERQVERTPWVDSLRRHTPISRNSIIGDFRDSSRERRISRDITISKKSLINSQQRSARSPTDSERREHLATRDISQERRRRFVEHNIRRERPIHTREGRTSETVARDDVRQKRTAMVNRIRNNPMDKHPEVRDERRKMHSMNIPKLEDVKAMSKTQICDYLRHALILGLCALYGASLLKDKGGSYSLRNILNRTSSLIAW